MLPELRIGKAVVRNVVVLVAPDDALTAGGYSLHGIIGFPVLYALKRLTFGTRVLRLDDPVTAGPVSWLFMDEMTPLIAANAEGATHLFMLDSGAARTVLSVRYARAHANELTHAKIGTRRLTGVGGTRAVPSYNHVTIHLAMGGAQLTLKDVDVLREGVGTDDDSFFGILGRDALQQLGSYTLDFERMEFSIP